MLRQSIVCWFPNHSKQKKNTKIPGFNGKTSFNSVLIDAKRDEIAALASELAENAPPGSKNWFSKYQIARAKIKRGLSESEREELVAKQKEWDEVGVPPEVQSE